MIRQPTSPADAYRWYVNALAGIRQDVDADAPQCGFFVLRGRTRRFRAVAIRLHQEIVDGELVAPERIEALLDGSPVQIDHVWPSCARHPVTTLEFARLMREIDPQQLHRSPTRP